jgi:ATP-dependent DNA ligase
LPPHSALDGEIVIARNALDFDSMQMRLHPAESRIRKLSAEIPAQFVVFDVLLWDGEPVWKQPLEERRARVGALDGFRTSPSTTDIAAARAWLDRFESMGLDGVVAKKLGVPYLPGSRDGVVKVKEEKTADCVVVGLRWKKEGEKIATLLLGLYRDDGGLTTSVVRRRGARMTRSPQVLPLLKDAPERRFSEPNRWGTGELEEAAVRPELCRRGALRQGAGEPLQAWTKLLRFRPDKNAADCTWEQARPKRRRGDPTVEELLAQASRSG